MLVEYGKSSSLNFAENNKKAGDKDPKGADQKDGASCDPKILQFNKADDQIGRMMQRFANKNRWRTLYKDVEAFNNWDPKKYPGVHVISVFDPNHGRAGAPSIKVIGEVVQSSFHTIKEKYCDPITWKGFGGFTHGCERGLSPDQILERVFEDINIKLYNRGLPDSSGTAASDKMRHLGYIGSHQHKCDLVQEKRNNHSAELYVTLEKIRAKFADPKRFFMLFNFSFTPERFDDNPQVHVVGSYDTIKGTGHIRIRNNDPKTRFNEIIWGAYPGDEKGYAEYKAKSLEETTEDLLKKINNELLAVGLPDVDGKNCLEKLV